VKYHYLLDVNNYGSTGVTEIESNDKNNVYVRQMGKNMRIRKRIKITKNKKMRHKEIVIVGARNTNIRLVRPL
jgi:hypothetical protein